MKALQNTQNNLEEHAEKLSSYSLPVLTLSPWHNYQVPAGNSSLFVKRTFAVAHYVFPRTSPLMVFTWHNSEYCKSSLSFIQNHPCRKSMHSSLCGNNYVICSGQLRP